MKNIEKKFFILIFIGILTIAPKIIKAESCDEYFYPLAGTTQKSYIVKARYGPLGWNTYAFAFTDKNNELHNAYCRTPGEDTDGVSYNSSRTSSSNKFCASKMNTDDEKSLTNNAFTYGILKVMEKANSAGYGTCSNFMYGSQDYGALWSNNLYGCGNNPNTAAIEALMAIRILDIFFTNQQVNIDTNLENGGVEHYASLYKYYCLAHNVLKGDSFTRVYSKSGKSIMADKTCFCDINNGAYSDCKCAGSSTNYEDIRNTYFGKRTQIYNKWKSLQTVYGMNINEELIKYNSDNNSVVCETYRNHVKNNYDGFSNDKGGEAFVKYTGVYMTSDGYDITNSSDLTSDISDYVLYGLEKMEEYFQKGVASLKISEPIVNDKSSTEKELYYTITAKNFNSDNKKIDISFNCDECQANNIEVSNIVVESNDKTISDYSNITDFGETLKVKVNLKVNTLKDIENLKIDTKLTVKYYDDSISAVGYKIAQKTSNSQQFYLLYSIGKDSEKSVKKSITWNKVNVDCTAKISYPSCSSTDTYLDLREGYIKDESCSGYEKLDIGKCIIDNNDMAGNSYKIFSNNYCSASCKEDYHVTLPGQKEVNSGRYFTLQASIVGKKACYSSEIKKETFKNDVTTASKETVDAYNDYIMYKKAYDVATDDATTDGPCTSSTVEVEVPTCAYKDGKYYSKEGQEITSEKFNEECSGVTASTTKIPKTTYKCTWNVQGVDYSGNIKNPRSAYENSLRSNDTYCASNSYGATCTYESETDMKDVYTSSLVSQRLNTLTKAVNNLEKIITDFEKCSSLKDQSDLDYNFAPEIKFWYEETYMDKTTNNNLETIGNPSFIGFNKETCLTVNESYMCLNSTDTSSTSYSYFSCDKSSKCESHDVKIPNANYVKLEKAVSASYITPTQFINVYTTGTIGIGDESNIDNAVNIENGLPIALNTKRGTYNYELQISNLGEFYGETKLGRIWGNKNSVVNAALSDSNACYKEGALQKTTVIKNSGLEANNGVYVCNYCVNTTCTNTCTKPDGSTVDMTACLKDHDYTYCEDTLCPGDNPNVCINEKTKEKVDMTDCLKKDINELCEERVDKGLEDNMETCLKKDKKDICTNTLCCPDCPTTGKDYYRCEKDSAGNYYGTVANKIVDYATYKSQCCPKGICQTRCIHCIYDDGVNFTYRTISSSDLNPNNRKLGVNWQYDENSITTQLELKAAVTTSEIQEKSDKVYDIDSSGSKIESDNTPIVFKVNSQMISYIREYNRGKNYLDNTLKCYDYKDSNGNTYKKIFCYSTFIDKLIEKFPKNVSVSSKRLNTDNLRKKSNDQNGYWTTWVEKTNTLSNGYKNWNIKTDITLAYNKIKKGEDRIGPSWK